MSVRRRVLPLVVAAGCGVAWGCGPSAAPDGDDASSSVREWPTYGGPSTGTKYSKLDVIDRSNVASLELAWSWETGEQPITGPTRPIRGQDVRPGNFEATPIVLGDTMVLPTPYNRVVALDAATGDLLWSYDPRTVEWGQPPNGTGFVHRGVAVWTGPGERRVFLNTRWRLIALDFATGRPIETFGYRGEIDLTEDLLWPTNRLHYTQTSPPLVVGDLVILGNGVWDGFVYPRDPPGNLQAFDVRTGQRAWILNLIPQPGEPGNETWEDGSWDVVGHTNAWAPMVADEERGLVYLGVGTPSNDYYGGHRRGHNLYAESIVCVDATTGRIEWHFQTVHHGLWDYDLPAPPVLFTVDVGEGPVDAVAVVGKTGFVYAFDRVSGEPLWPVEDVAVPSSDVPGEVAAPTQPRPTLPEPFARQRFTPDDLIDLTPELRRRAVELTKGLRFGDMYTPPSLEGTMAMPGIIGGGNWGGAAVTPAGILFVKSTEEPSVLKIAPGDPEAVVADYAIDRSSPRTLRIDGIPVSNPPWGTLTAIDLTTGRIAWQEPVGDQPDLRSHPLLEDIELPERLGVQGAPGPVATAGGLVFLSGGGDILYAFDTDTGEVLWEFPLPARGYANPMTYGTEDGRQFVSIATGGGSDPASLLTFSLPEEE